MRFSKIKLLTVFFGVLIAIFWLVTPMAADAPGKHLKSFSKWMRMLPKEKRIQVETVLESHMDCLENVGETSPPDLTKWREKVVNDLQSILSPGQLKEFNEIMNGKTGEQLSRTASQCWDCYSPLQALDDAWAHLLGAEARYNKSYCDYGFYPDQVLPFIIAARANADLASQKALDAFNNCDCDSAKAALSYARKALDKLEYAIDHTIMYCYSYPWLNRLFMARTYLNTAISELPTCIAETCN
jgi:hypothetical protein